MQRYGLDSFQQLLGVDLARAKLRVELEFGLPRTRRSSGLADVGRDTGQFLHIQKRCSAVQRRLKLGPNPLIRPAVRVPTIVRGQLRPPRFPVEPPRAFRDVLCPRTTRLPAQLGARPVRPPRLQQRRRQHGGGYRNVVFGRWCSGGLIRDCSRTDAKPPTLAVTPTWQHRYRCHIDARIIRENPPFPPLICDQRIRLIPRRST